MTTSHGRSGNLSENFFRNSREFAVALKLAFLNLERLPFGVMSVQDVSRPRLSRVPPATMCANSDIQRRVIPPIHRVGDGRHLRRIPNDPHVWRAVLQLFHYVGA